MDQNLIYEVKGPIAYVTVNRPEVLNALNTDVLEELYQTFQEVERDGRVRCAVLTGSGRAFVAGADIAKMYRLKMIEGRAMMKLGHKLMNFMEDMEKPILAAINGFALGGGCELAMACDIRFASVKAKFGQPEINLGIIPCFGGTQRLPHLAGKGMAKYLIYTGELITAAEAWRLGLVDVLTEPEELMERVEETAQMIAGKSPIALAAAKVAINRGYAVDPWTGGALEVEAFTQPFGSEDKREGMGAFLEKRAPRFQNR